MKKLLIPVAIASLLAVSASQANTIQDDNNPGDSNVGVISIGAVSGAILAGPAGFIVGGIVAALVGDYEPDVESGETLQLAEPAPDEMNVELVLIEPELMEDSITLKATMTTGLIEADVKNEINAIEEIVSNDLGMDVYFKAGSVDVEHFYSQQLSVLTSLMREIPDLKLNLDGYSDRRGDASDNYQLSIARLESVREYFVQQGIDNSRITLHAYGEKNFISTAGDLDAYIFDRRVEVSFISITSDSQTRVAQTHAASSL